MSDVDLNSIPELGEDQVLNSLIETFDARLIQAESRENYIGNLTTRVRMGEHEYLTLPTVRLTVACSKAELERARATMFATYLLQLGRESARQLWKQVAPWEGEEFMAWVKLDVEWKQQQGERA
jgi:hypothetical protein